MTSSVPYRKSFTKDPTTLTFKSSPAEEKNSKFLHRRRAVLKFFETLGKIFFERNCKPAVLMMFFFTLT